MLFGAVLISLKMKILSAVSLSGNGLAGLVLTASCRVPVPFGLLFGVWFTGWSFIVRTTLFTMMLVSFSLAADYTLRINSLLIPFAAFFRGTATGMEVLRVLRHSTGVEGDGHCRLSASRAKGWYKGLVTLMIDVMAIFSALPVIGLFA